MNLASHGTKNGSGTLFLMELPFWLCFAFWSILPSTQTPWFEVANIPVNAKDVGLIAIALLYCLLPKFSNRPIATHHAVWHYHLPILTLALLLYAGASIDWSGAMPEDRIAMLYTLVLTAAAVLFGYSLVAKRDLESLRSFLWFVTVAIAAVGLLYSAESFFSLGLGTENTYESESFGIQRVRGPLFVSTTGFFILIPALAFAIQELLQSGRQRLLNVAVIISLTLTVIGLGSRAGLLILGLSVLIMILFIKNKKQSRNVFALMMIVITITAFLFFSRAKTDRLQSLEDSSRLETHRTSLQIIANREDTTNFFGSGYGSYWPWYLPDIQGVLNTRLYFDLTWNPYGPLLYHPHSTLLLCIVELGVPGLIYFVFLWSVLIRLLLRNRQNTAFPILSCGVFASGFSMFFDFFLFRSAQVNALWWLFLFAALALNSDIASISSTRSRAATPKREDKA